MNHQHVRSSDSARAPGIPQPYPPILDSRTGAHRVATIDTRQSVLRWDLSSTERRHRTADSDVPLVSPLLRRESSEKLPDPLAWSTNMVRAIIDSLGGRRDLAGLRRWIDPPLCRRLEARAQCATSETRTTSIRIRTARIYRVNDSTAETAIVMEDQGRVRAAAVRIETFRGRWRITALELG